MRYINKVIAVILSIVCLINLCMIPVYADSNSSVEDVLESETVIIDNVSYRFDFYSVAENEITRVTNLDTGEADIVLYNISEDAVYINGKLSISRLQAQDSINSYGSTADGWQILGKDSYYVSWAVGTSTAVVATAIAAYLSTLGPAGVIAAMGTAALGSLASSCSGGTLYRELHMYSNPIQYRYKWSFRAPTGTTYGAYYYTV